MSYILDALRRAEADRERERGQVPGLHAQPLAGSPAAPATGLRRWLPWAGGGLLVLLGIGAGSWWAGSPQDAPAPAGRATPPAPAVALQPTAPQATPAPPLAAPPQLPATAAAPTPLPPLASASPGVPPVLERPSAQPLAAAAPAVAPAPPPASETRIPRLAELPEALRRELPRLAISGSVYSDDPASRFVIVNGEVVREGAKLGPDLALEQIQPHELVLRFKGQRYRQPI